MSNRKHHTSPAKRGPRAGQAHKQWAHKRSNRPEQVALRNRGYEKLMAFFGVAA